MARGLGALVWDAEAEPLVSSSLRRRMTHRSARSTSKLASATGPERFAPVLVRRGRRAVWSGRQVRSDQVPTSSAVPSAVGSRETHVTLARTRPVAGSSKTVYSTRSYQIFSDKSQKH